MTAAGRTLEVAPGRDHVNGDAAATRGRLRLEAVLGGALLGAFQLVGRSQAAQFLGGDAGRLLELRLWVLALLTLWLSGIAAVHRPSMGRFPQERFGAWSGMLALFLAYMAVTSLWAPDQALAAAKSYDLLFVAWAAVLAAAALRLCGVAATIEGFWAALFGLGMVLAVAGLFSVVAGPGPQWHGTQRLAILGGGPNVFGRNMGLLALAGLRHVFDDRRWLRRPALATVPLAAFLLLQSGSRGAMLAAFIGVVVYLGLGGVDRRVRRSLAFAGLAFTVGALATEVGRLAILIFQKRFLVLLLAQRYFTHRDAHLLDGITAGIGNPVGGLGLAGFALFPQTGAKTALYPHNMFVEAFAEGGLLGLSLLCAPFVGWLRRWRRGLGPGDPAIVAGLSLLLVSSSISGDLFDARGVFLMLMMAVASQKERAPGAGTP